MIHPLDHPVVRGAGQADVVPGLEVSHHVTKSNPACMRTDRNTLEVIPVLEVDIDNSEYSYSRIHLHSPE